MTISVIFEVGALSCALPRKEVKEILPLPSLVLAPGMPATLAGFVQLERQYLPVVDLRFLFHATVQALTIDQHLLRLANHSWLCLVDRVLELAPLPVSEPLKPEHSFNDWVMGLSYYQGHEIALLDINQVLLKEEQTRMTSLQEMLQARLQALE